MVFCYNMHTYTYSLAWLRELALLLHICLSYSKFSLNLRGICMQSVILFPEKLLPYDGFSLKQMSLNQGGLYIVQACPEPLQRVQEWLQIPPTRREPPIFLNPKSRVIGGFENKGCNKDPSSCECVCALPQANISSSCPHPSYIGYESTDDNYRRPMYGGHPSFLFCLQPLRNVHFLRRCLEHYCRCGLSVVSNLGRY